MKKKFSKIDGLIFLFALFGLVIFLFLYPQLFPEAALRMDIDKEEIIKRGTSFVKDLGYDVQASPKSIKLVHDADQLRYLNQTFGSGQTNSLMADSIPVFYWVLRWSSEKVSSIQIEGREGEITQGLERVYRDIRLFIDVKGNPIQFESIFWEGEGEGSREQSGVSEEIDRREADRVAERLSEIYGGTWVFRGGTEKTNRWGIVHQYLWNRETHVAGEDVFLGIVVQDGRVRSLRKVFAIPKTQVKTKKEDIGEDFAISVVVLLIVILGIVHFFKRLRSDLLDFKNGLIPCILVILGWFLNRLVQGYWNLGEPTWEMILDFLITAPLVGGSIWVLFVLGESLTREVWAEKLGTLDTLRKKILFPEFSLALLNGIALVFMGLGLTSLLNYVGVNLFRGYFKLGDSPLYFWTSSWPSLYAVSKSLLSSLYIVIIYCPLFLTLLRRRFEKMLWIMGISFVLWSLVSFPIPRLQPFIFRMLINGLLGLLFTFFFLRYDFVTVATGALGIPILFYGIATLSAGNGIFTLNGFILLGILGAILLLAFIAYRSKPLSQEFVPYVPDYLQRIYERERIQRELEIARHVQLSFLPRKNPKIKGMDIASLCLPAREVGGDYYDFIEINPRKLGVVIGDVSGKGISAAFYMTLTKGFLKSQAKGSFSPKEVLVNMNDLFYENSERGIFISMIYGIFDLNAMTLTISRAGHNPMILRRSGHGVAEEICPSGIALGLEYGAVFNKTIEERKIEIKKKDVFMFYTDGLNEAQNQLRVEYGEERLMQLVEAHNDLSAEKLLKKIQQDIQYFAAKASQHDDMTAVIVKIL